MAQEQTSDMAKIIAKNVRAERLRLGMSQQKLANLTGLTVRYISRLETEPQNIRVDKIGIIARAMGIKPERLIQRSETTEPDASAAEELAHVIRQLQAVHAKIS